LSIARLSRKAEEDLEAIFDYTVDQWGRNQANVYVNELENACRLIANQASLGIACELLAPGLRRYTQGSHVIFYRSEKDGIV
jgi:toxin ParE1/3/4